MAEMFTKKVREVGYNIGFNMALEEVDKLLEECEDEPFVSLVDLREKIERMRKE